MGGACPAAMAWPGQPSGAGGAVEATEGFDGFCSTRTVGIGALFRPGPSDVP